MSKTGKTGITDGKAGNNKKGTVKAMLKKEMRKGGHIRNKGKVRGSEMR